MTHNSTYEYFSKENINTKLKIYMQINVYMKKNIHAALYLLQHYLQ